MLLGLSQSELARAVGVAFQQLQKYETGANRISAGRLFALAQRLGVPVGYFFGEDVSASGGATVKGGIEILTLVRYFERVQRKGLREAIIRVAAAAAGPP